MDSRRPSRWHSPPLAMCHSATDLPPQGPFQPEMPTRAGTWYVQALVEETAQYQGLEAVASFRIDPAIPEYLAPDTKTATYGDYLADVSLEPQFFWENGSLRVGNAGEQTHLAFYVPEDWIDYQVVQHIPVLVQVAPYDGTRLPIPQITSRAEAENLAIRHGDWTLEKGKDYVTEFEEQGGSVRFLIHFQGNYTGTVSCIFTENTGSGGGDSSSQTFVITANATGGGTITPSGTVRVTRGQTPGFTMRANKGYRLDAVLVDGKPVDTERTYRFAPVTKNHTISARFVPLDTPVSPDDTGVSDYTGWLRICSAWQKRSPAKADKPYSRDWRSCLLWICSSLPRPSGGWRSAAGGLCPAITWSICWIPGTGTRLCSSGIRTWSCPTPFPDG